MAEHRLTGQYFPGDLVRVEIPGLDPVRGVGVILQSYDPVVYQPGSADVLLHGVVHRFVQHSYLMHVDRLSKRGPGLDSSH